MGEGCLWRKSAVFPVYSCYYTELLLYMVVEQDEPEELACI